MDSSLVPKVRDSKLYEDQQKLLEYTGFVDSEAFNQWLDDEVLFKDAYDELIICWIQPEEDLSERSSPKSSQGPRLNTVVGRLVDGDISGQHPEKSDWHSEDHYARFLVKVVDVNIIDCKGIFWSKHPGIHEEEMQYQVWQILQWCLSERSRARRTGTLLTNSAIAQIISPTTPRLDFRRPQPSKPEAETNAAEASIPIVKNSSNPTAPFGQHFAKAINSGYKEGKNMKK